MKTEKRKIILFYALVIVALVRIVVAPLHDRLKDREALLKDYTQTYVLRKLQIERLRAEKSSRTMTASEKGSIQSLYGKDVPYATIQSEVLQKIIGMAGEAGLTTVNFELPDVTPGKNISEIPVVIRVEGQPKSFVALLRSISDMDKRIDFEHVETSKSFRDFIFGMNLSVFRAER